MNKKILSILVLILVFAFDTTALASLTFTTDAITGTSASTIDLGAGNTLYLNSTNNAPITTGTGLFTAPGGISSTLFTGPVTALKSATTSVDVSAATAPTTGQVLTATDGTIATWQTPSNGGLSGLTTGRVILSTGATTVGDNAGLTFTSRGLKIGTNAGITSDPQVEISRNVDDSVVGNGHAFHDASIVTRAGGIGYASYNTGPTFSGTADFNHYNSYQAVSTYSSSGTIDNVFGVTSDLNVTSGVVTTRTGFKVTDAYVTGGSVGTQSGFVCGELTSATNNWCFNSSGPTTASYHVGPLRLGGITTGSHRIGILGGTLAVDSSNKILNASQTFNASPTGTQQAIKFTLTTAGAAGFQQHGHLVEMQAGYTGGATTIASAVSNAAAGTANSFSSVGGGNLGLQAYVSRTTTGMNAAVWGQAANGTRSIGIVGQSLTTKNSGTNIGIWGQAINAGTTPIQVGGYFGLTTAATPQVPTTSAALIANNGATSDPIARFQVNGSDKVVIGATGGVQLVTSTRPACDATTRGTFWYVAGGAGVADTMEVCRKDSADAYAWVAVY